AELWKSPLRNGTRTAPENNPPSADTVPRNDPPSARARWRFRAAVWWTRPEARGPQDRSARAENSRAQAPCPGMIRRARERDGVSAQRWGAGLAPKREVR